MLVNFPREESLPQTSSDHIGELLDTLEHDLCDNPLSAMVQALKLR